MKLCKDCKHFTNNGLWSIVLSPFSRQFAKCTHAESSKVNATHLIMGTGGGAYCTTMRVCDCGVAGKLFEAKS